jgi:pyruvate kinase
MAAIYIADNFNIKAISAALTQSGANRPMAVSAAQIFLYPFMPYRQMLGYKVARRKLTLHRGVYPYPIDLADEGKKI